MRKICAFSLIALMGLVTPALGQSAGDQGGQNQQQGTQTTCENNGPDSSQNNGVFGCVDPGLLVLGAGLLAGIGMVASEGKSHSGQSPQTGQVSP
jgi:hypothetical protein